jgi:hypothetical protein
MNLVHAAVVRNINDAVCHNSDLDLVVKIQSFVSLAFIARLIVELHEKLSLLCIEKVIYFSVGSSHNPRQVKLLIMAQYLMQIPSENGSYFTTN